MSERFNGFISGSLMDDENSDFLQLFELPAFESELKMLILSVMEQDSSAEIDMKPSALALKKRLLLCSLRRSLDFC